MSEVSISFTNRGICKESITNEEKFNFWNKSQQTISWQENTAIPTPRRTDESNVTTETSQEKNKFNNFQGSEIMGHLI